MKTQFTIAVVMFACLVTACRSDKEFTSRKYMPGRYISYAKHKKKIDKIASRDEKPVALHRVDKKESVMAGPHVKVNPAVEVNMLSFKEKFSKTASKRFVKKQVRLDKSKLIPIFNKRSIRKPKYSNQRSAQPPTTISLVATILSGVGVIFDVVGLFVLVYAMDYIFLACTMIGLALGIVGLVFGILGIKKYKTEKESGNKNVATLVLGIVGTALGGVAIILGAFYSLFGLLFLSF